MANWKIVFCREKEKKWKKYDSLPEMEILQETFQTFVCTITILLNLTILQKVYAKNSEQYLQIRSTKSVIYCHLI